MRGGFAYVVDANNRVYVYELSDTGATYNSARSFSISPTVTNPSGISVLADLAYIYGNQTRVTAGKVYKFNLSSSGATYDSILALDAISRIAGMDYDAGFLYLVRSSDDKVYVYS